MEGAAGTKEDVWRAKRERNKSRVIRMALGWEAMDDGDEVSASETSNAVQQG